MQATIIIRLLNVLLLLFPFVSLMAQAHLSYIMQKVNLKGLPTHTPFYSLQQDKDGFLWIGSLSGLYKYDGSRITRFLRDPGDTNSLSHNYTKSLVSDKDGNTWIGTYGGFLNKFERTTGQIKRTESSTRSKIRMLLNKVKNSYDGQHIVAAGERWLYLITPQFIIKDSFLFPRNQSFINTVITDFKEYAPKKFIITTSSGLFHLDWSQKILNQVPVESAEYFSCIEQDLTGDFWIGTRYSFLILSQKNFEVQNRSFNNNDLLKNRNIRVIKKDTDDRMWLGTDSGVFIFHYHTGSFQKIETANLSPENVNDILIEKKNGIWIATENNGIYKAYAPGIVFQTIPGMQKYSEKNWIGSVLEENNGVWLIGTTTGLYRYYFSSNRMEQIRLNEANSGLFVRSLLKDKEGGLWAGTRESGIFYQPKGESTFIHFLRDSSDENSISFNHITSLTQGHDGKIWIGIFNGSTATNSLCYYDPTTKKISRAKVNLSSVSQIQTEKDELWISTYDNGLFRYNLKKETTYNGVTHFTENLASPHTISHIIATCVEKAKNGNIWFGTVSGGMNKVNTKNDSVSWFTVKNGLPSNLVYRIEEDDKGILWISTDNGISRFDPSTESFINYNTNSGLPTNDFTFLASMKCKDGTLVFGTKDGQVVYFNPTSFEEEVNDQAVLLSDIKLFNKSLSVSANPLLKRSPWLTDTIILKHDQSVISFELANMDFRNPEVYTYAYLLKGFDKGWTYMNDKNSITYTNLDPGTYTLFIKQANSLGIWNNTPTRLTLIIQPPFWRTWWFYCMVAALVLLLAYISIKEIIYRKLEKQRLVLEKQSAIDTERLRISSELHDDLGGGLSTIRLMSELVQQDNQNGNTKKHLEKISFNSKELVQKMNEIVWALNIKNDTLPGLLAYIRQYAARFTDDNMMAFDLSVPEQIPGVTVTGSRRRDIFLLVKESLNNIIKHAGASKIRMKILINNSMQIIIHDDGVGFDTAALSATGNGLRNMGKRATALSGTMTIKNHNGTTLIFDIPLKNMSHESVH